MTLRANEIPYLPAIYFTDNLMYSFVNQVEETIRSQIHQYNQHGAGFFAEGEYRIGHCLEHYRGLTNQELKPDEIVTEYFPSLQRRSAFLTVYSVYEVELQALCRSYHHQLGGKDFDHYRGFGSGIVKVHNYIKNYFPGLENIAEWQLLDQIRVLRNHCVHYNGNTYRGNKPVEKITLLIETYPSLFHHDGPEDPEGETYLNGTVKRTGRNIIFEAESLPFIIEAFKAYVAIVHHHYTAIRT